MMMVIFVCILLVRKRFRNSKKRYQETTTTMRDGAWTIVPNGNQLHPGSNYDGSNRGDFLLPNPLFQMTPTPTPTTNHYSKHGAPTYSYVASVPSCGYASSRGMRSQSSYAQIGTKNNEFGHEYSEIGSITADSGRGDSLNGNNDEKHYAQVNAYEQQ